MSSRRFILPLLLVVPVIACDRPSGDRPASGTVRDSAGITIVENAAPAWSEGGAWTVSAEPTLAMGVSEGDPDHEFYQIAGVTRLSDGTIVVANAGTQQLRYYAPDGALQRSVGRKGGGPGEFAMLMTALGVPGDSILTFDAMNRRLSLFDPVGRHVRDFGASDASNPVPLLVRGRLDDGAYVAQLTTMRIGAAMLERTPGPARDSLYVLRLDATGVPADTFGLFPGPRSEVQMIEVGPRSMPMPIMIPFSPMTHVATGAGRVYIGTSDTYEVRAYTPAGELTTLIRRSHEARPVTQADIEEMRASMTEVLEGQANPFAAQFREAYAKVPFPETMPAFGELLVDRDGNLWVADAIASPDEARRWSVFDRNGGWLGDVTTPPRLGVQEIGNDYVLGHATDDAEVERVLLYALLKPTP
jgi:hypothetical protein